MFENVSSTFRTFMWIYFLIAILVVVMLFVAAFRNMRRTSEQLRAILRDVLIIGALFGIFSWIIS